MLRRTLLDHPSNDQILEGARVTLEKWFAREQPWGAQIIANVRGVVRRRAIELPDYCSVAATSDGLRPRLTMAGDTFASVALELLYFGGADAMPWPVLDTRGEWLPHDCVWALDLVGAA
ncbi:MAG TPA: hypothetical protein VFQ35_05960 [Polyangiaceae bacterium]|nr:hypothetical protein [Polyangiaceae bacterium]